MITFKAIVIPGGKRKDGIYPVKIRVTFKGVSRRLPTTLACSTNDLTKSLRIKNADILMRAEQIINQMRIAVRDLTPFDLEVHDVDWVVRFIRAKLSGNGFTLDFFAFADEYIKRLKPSTAAQYGTAVHSLERFLGRRELDINDITKFMLTDYMAFINNEPKMLYNQSTKTIVPSSQPKLNNGQSVRMLAKLQKIFTEAKKKYNDEDAGVINIPRSPFSAIEKNYPSTVRGQKSIGVETMQRLIDTETDNKLIRTTVDLFVVSFGLMGANLADLASAPPFKGDLWVYERAKTRDRRDDRAEMRVTVPEQIRPFLERLQGKSKEWWLPVLHKYGKDSNHIGSRLREGLRRWCAMNDVEPFTIYAARHTWATLARKLGVEKALVDECLAHVGDFRIADIYAERNWDAMKEANEKVLSLFRW